MNSDTAAIQCDQAIVSARADRSRVSVIAAVLPRLGLGAVVTGAAIGINQLLPAVSGVLIGIGGLCVLGRRRILPGEPPSDRAGSETNPATPNDRRMWLVLSGLARLHGEAEQK